MQSIIEIHENIVSQKFGAIQYVHTHIMLFAYISSCLFSPSAAMLSFSSDKFLIMLATCVQYMALVHDHAYTHIIRLAENYHQGTQFSKFQV